MKQTSKILSFHKSARTRQGIGPVFVVLTAIPALGLFAFWLGGETALFVETLAITTLLIAAYIFFSKTEELRGQATGSSNLDKKGFELRALSQMDLARENNKKSAIFHVGIDDQEAIFQVLNEAQSRNLTLQVLDRIRTQLREKDLSCALDKSTFAICIHPQISFDLETCLELSGRISAGMNDPYIIDNEQIFLSVSIGFCQLGRETSSREHLNREPVSRCAEIALASAMANAPCAIRAYTPDIQTPLTDHLARSEDAIAALENGEIVPWFQPQVSTDTGKITGFEALARWIHPVNGTISPAKFLPQLEEAGLMSRLFEVMICESLAALKSWDLAGLDIDQVGVNFSSDELSDPKLVEKVTWQLDRFELSPDRLCVEVLETVVAKGPDDIITRNVKALHALGCKIDLDDFGAGHASLASISRFGAGRIKIDRSFVSKADRDADQQRMIRAILTMAEKLELETLAEGVETVGEHSLLAQLGCSYVQGFGIGRPMPLDQTFVWADEYNSKLQSPPEIGRAAG